MGAGAETPWKRHIWRTKRSSTRGSSTGVVLFQGLRAQHHSIRWQGISCEKNASGQLSPRLTPVMKQKPYFFRALEEQGELLWQKIFSCRIIHLPGLCLWIRIWPSKFQAQPKIQKECYCCNCDCVCHSCCYYDYDYDYCYWPMISQSLRVAWVIRSHQPNLPSTTGYCISSALSCTELRDLCGLTELLLAFS